MYIEGDITMRTISQKLKPNLSASKTEKLICG